MLPGETYSMEKNWVNRSKAQHLLLLQWQPPDLKQDDRLEQRLQQMQEFPTVDIRYH